MSSMLPILPRKEIKQHQINRKLCGAVTEEGKRNASETEQSARGQVRLPSSVTLPQTFDEIICFIVYEPFI